MGSPRIGLRLRAIAGDVSQEIDLLVDASSTYSWIPRGVLESLGVKPRDKWSFRIATGERAFRDVGDIIVEWRGRSSPTTVVFAQKGDASVFGTHGLDGLGLEVDPVTREVRMRSSLDALVAKAFVRRPVIQRE